MSIECVGVGAGGHARVVIEILRADDRFRIVSLVDASADLWGQAVLGVPVIGGDDGLAALRQEGICHFFVGVGSTGDNSTRRRLYELGLECGMEPVTAVHPSAIVSASAEIGCGATVGAAVVVNAGARVGVNVILNTGAIIEHDCVVGDHAHVATGASLAGGVQVGEGAHIGAGAVVRQETSVGAGSIVGAGAAVVRDVQPRTVVVGVPARVLDAVRKRL